MAWDGIKRRRAPREVAIAEAEGRKPSTRSVSVLMVIHEAARNGGPADR
jgi:hypothetical protein